MNVTDLNKFYERYKADLQDGFVSSTDTYVRRKLGALPDKTIEEIINELEKRLKNEISDVI